MRELLMLICFAIVAGAAPQSIRDVDWKNYSYPLPETDGVPGEVRWMAPGTKAIASLSNGRFVVTDDSCSDNIRDCPSVTFDSVRYGALTGITSTLASVVLTYHTGGTAHWQYVYLYSLDAGKPRLIDFLRTGSRADQGLRAVSIAGGNLILVVNDPDKRQGDCCSAGTITTRYRWTGSSFSPIAQPEYKTDPPSFDCAKAATPVERLVCQEVELSFLDSQMASSYRSRLTSASAGRKEIIRQEQAKWLADYSRTCNVNLTEPQRHECIYRHLSDRLATIWKSTN
ncbi:MAG: hypothetical protein ABI972_21220 [Acidobacteriota bacterium]